MRRILIGAIRAYQTFSRAVPASSLLPAGISGCRSWPTCSEYAVQAIERKGVLKGLLSATLHVIRCNPLSAVRYHG